MYKETNRDPSNISLARSSLATSHSRAPSVLSSFGLSLIQVSRINQYSVPRQQRDALRRDWSTCASMSDPWLPSVQQSDPPSSHLYSQWPLQVKPDVTCKLIHFQKRVH